MNKKIIKIRKNINGDITDVMLSDGDIFSLNHVITLAKKGSIEGICVGTGRNGAEFLKSDLHEVGSDTLRDLSTF
jgi:hypothetical protein